ncbi:MAG: hypothetical protein M3332_08830 [Actinomycetota bacterium]|nr:hypothetical protein [Actinomycetota bacterium]
MASRQFPGCAAALASLCAAGLISACSEPSGAAPAVPIPPSVAPSSPPTPSAPAAPAPPEVALDRYNRALLAQARRSGQPVVILRVATEPGRTAEAIAGLEELGGIVGLAGTAGVGGPAADYLRVSIPTGNVERAAALPAVTAVDINQLIPRNSPRPQGAPP